MIINLSPVRMDETLMVDREGDVLMVNGESFDFGPLLEGATLPASAIDSRWFTGQVDRVDGELHLTMILPHGANAPDEARFPKPIILPDDGPVDLPEHSLPAPELPEDDLAAQIPTEVEQTEEEPLVIEGELAKEEIPNE